MLFLQRSKLLLGEIHLIFNKGKYIGLQAAGFLDCLLYPALARRADFFEPLGELALLVGVADFRLGEEVAEFRPLLFPILGGVGGKILVGNGLEGKRFLIVLAVFLQRFKLKAVIGILLVGLGDAFFSAPE